MTPDEIQANKSPISRDMESLNNWIDRFEFTQWFAQEPLVWPIEDWEP